MDIRVCRFYGEEYTNELTSVSFMEKILPEMHTYISTAKVKTIFFHIENNLHMHVHGFEVKGNCDNTSANHALYKGT